MQAQWRGWLQRARIVLSSPNSTRQRSRGYAVRADAFEREPGGCAGAGLYRPHCIRRPAGTRAGTRVAAGRIGWTAPILAMRFSRPRHLRASRRGPRTSTTAATRSSCTPLLRRCEPNTRRSRGRASISGSILRASIENTVHQLGLTFGSLLEEPARWRMLLAAPDRIPEAIDERLQLRPRFCTIFRYRAARG